MKTYFIIWLLFFYTDSIHEQSKTMVVSKNFVLDTQIVQEQIFIFFTNAPAFVRWRWMKRRYRSLYFFFVL